MRKLGAAGLLLTMGVANAATQTVNCGRLLDVKAGVWRENVTVYIENGAVKAIEPRTKAATDSVMRPFENSETARSSSARGDCPCAVAPTTSHESTKGQATKTRKHETIRYASRGTESRFPLGPAHRKPRRRRTTIPCRSATARTATAGGRAASNGRGQGRFISDQASRWRSAWPNPR